jgi:DNA polymerase-3 subunit alpha
VFDLFARIDMRSVNRRVVESLNRAGAFASTGWNRRQVESVLDDALSEGQISQRERDAGQTSLLDLMGSGDDGASYHAIPDLPEWPEHELLAYEKEMLGLYVSSHPLARHALTLQRFSSVRLVDLPDLRDGQEIVIGGLVSSVKQYITQRGNKKMAFVSLDTLEGPLEVTVFADLYEQKGNLLLPDAILMVPSRMGFRNGEPSLVANDLVPIEEAENQLTRAVHVRVSAVELDESVLEQLASLLGERPGKCDVYVHFITPEQDDITVHATNACRVEATPSLREEVEQLLGADSFWFSGGNGLPRHADEE